MAKKKKNIPPPIKQQVEQKKTQVVTPQPKVAVATPVKTYKPKAEEAKSMTFVFGKINYIIMLVGIVLIAIGFLLMIGGGSNDPKVFNPAIFDPQRLTFSTIFILLGFGIEIYAIMKKPKSEAEQPPVK